MPESENKLFGNGAALKQPAQGFGNDLASLQTRLRLIEEKSSNLNGKIELLENNFVSSNQKRN